MYHITQQGHGQVLRPDAQTWQLSLPTSATTAYSNAQISDYNQERHFIMRPPLRLELEAWMDVAHVSHKLDDVLRGTAGFGWWNHPFAPDARLRDVRLPQAVWFFFSGRDSRMPLARNQPAYGWKAATFNAQQMLFYALLPLAPLGFVVMRVPYLHRRLWGIGQKALGVHEQHLETTTLLQKHTYRIDWWGKHGADFYVNDVRILHAPSAPDSALGFVAWLDNQYAIVTPQGQFGWGIAPTPAPVSLMLQNVQIEDIR
jgi:hypothetical protein